MWNILFILAVNCASLTSYELLIIHNVRQNGSEYMHSTASLAIPGVNIFFAFGSYRSTNCYCYRNV